MAITPQQLPAQAGPPTHSQGEGLALGRSTAALAQELCGARGWIYRMGAAGLTHLTGFGGHGWELPPDWGRTPSHLLQSSPSHALGVCVLR